MNMPQIEKLPKFLTPKAFNVDNPVQAAGAARGRENRYLQQNSVGVQQLRQIVELLRSSELAGYIIKPRAAHGVIQIYRLRRLAESVLYKLPRLASRDTPSKI
jgi:hypothetical protein